MLDRCFGKVPFLLERLDACLEIRIKFYHPLFDGAIKPGQFVLGLVALRLQPKVALYDLGITRVAPFDWLAEDILEACRGEQ